MAVVVAPSSCMTMPRFRSLFGATMHAPKRPPKGRCSARRSSRGVPGRLQFCKAIENPARPDAPRIRLRNLDVQVAGLPQRPDPAHLGTIHLAIAPAPAVEYVVLAAWQSTSLSLTIRAYPWIRARRAERLATASIILAAGLVGYCCSVVAIVRSRCSCAHHCARRHSTHCE